MTKKSTKEVVYFVLVFIAFYLGAKLAEFWTQQAKINPDVSLIIIGIIVTLVLAIIYYFSDMSCSEGFWDVTLAALCKGGPYMWQGDSEQAKMCRNMAKTPEGRCAISSYNCPTGTVGTPMMQFQYDKLSNDNWENERCQGSDETCPCTNSNAMCSTVAQSSGGSYPKCSE